jgi:effector-binding domain-containing protein
VTEVVYEVEVVPLQPQPAAIIHAHVTVADIPGFIGGAFGEVIQTLSGQGLSPAGPPFGRYVAVDDGFDVEAGFPTTGVVQPSGRVVACELPGGQAARVLHRGAYAGVAAAYSAASEWLTAHGYVATGPPWESYLDGPEVAEPRTVVCLPCRPE